VIVAAILAFIIPLAARATVSEGVATDLTETFTFNVIASTQSVDVDVSVDLRPYGDGGCAPGATSPPSATALAILVLCAALRQRRRAQKHGHPSHH